MFRYEWIWQKNKGVNFLNAKHMPLRLHENILVFYQKLPVYNPQKWQSKPYTQHKSRNYSSNYVIRGPAAENYHSESKDGKRYPLDCLQFSIPNSRGKGDKSHPTQKPVELLEYLIKTYTNEGETVLDNCIGSGSTAVACVNTNRNFIGFETELKYYEIACKRVTEAQTAKEMKLAL